MSYDRNNLKETTEDGINDLVNDVIGGIVSLDHAFTEIKYKPLQKKISKALELRDDEDWVKASTENSVESYSNYLSSYNRERPWYIGRHVADAKSILSELSKSIEDIDEDAWEIASTADTKESYQSYLSTYDKSAPDYIGKHVNDAQSALNTIALKEQDEDDWQDALTQNSEDGYNAYLSKYNNVDEDYVGLHVSDALNAIDSLQKDKRDKEQADREISECKSAWKTVRSINTIQAYQDFVNKYGSSSYDEVQPLVVQAKNQILSIQDDEDWKLALKTNTQKGYDRYIAKYEPLKSEYQGKYLDKAKSWIPGKPNPRIKHIVSACIVVSLIGVFLYFMFWWKPGRKPLSEEEINTILVQYTDSLKQDLFDGFYLSPISKADIAEASLSRVYEESNALEESLESGLYSREDVIKKFMLDNGKFIVKNRNGETIKLPEANNGIDSICVKDSPFFEYIDNNGLRRVVALYKDGIYYYMGECGTHDGIRQFILANEIGEYGLVDIKKAELKHFEHEKIAISSSGNGFFIKNGNTTQNYNFAGNAIEPSVSVSVSKTNSVIALENFYDSKTGAWGYKTTSGTIVVKPTFKSCSHRIETDGHGTVTYKSGKKGFIDSKGNVYGSFDYIDNYYSDNCVKVKNNGFYGIYNRNSKKMVLPTIYEDVSIYGSSTNMFPAKKNGKWGYVQNGGNEIIGFKFAEAYSFSPTTKLAVVKNDDGKCGYIDMTGNYKIQPQYYSAGTMSPDGARVMMSSNEYGFINLTGSLIASWYPYMDTKFVLNRIMVQNQNNLRGFVDRHNNLVIPYIFDSDKSYTFDEKTHLCKVSYNGVEWFINTNGAFAFPVNGKPTDQNISLQIQKAMEEAERKLKEKEETENKRNSEPDRKRNSQHSKV
ncbi:MAG: WG repeat-containing protein [Muribaculum sp.]|nr:WG repeat-containing protein [Muribaculum sp.]